MKKYSARLAASPEDYTRLGLNRQVQLREDGLHTSGRFGEYEWWYFDSRLEGGGSLVIVFYSQPMTAAHLGFAPSITFHLIRDGEEVKETLSFAPGACEMSRDRCCLRFGDCLFEGDLQNYRIRVSGQRVKAEVQLRSNAAPWRPETGRFLFNEKRYFAWLPSVPEGRMEAEITVDGRTMHLTGSGYHDHNWGNAGMYWLMHHWYWGRASVGPYQVISSYITAREKYGHEHFPIFLVLKDGVKLGDDPRCLTYTQEEPAFDPVTEKHYHRRLVYDYDDGSQRIRVTYAAQQIIETFTVREARDSAQAKAGGLLLGIVKLAGLSPSYIRMTGTVTLERFERGEPVERIEAPGLWEQMYFGTDADV